MLLSKIRKTIDRYYMLGRGDRVIVAVSGGIDSVVMLHLLKRLEDEYRLKLIVAHLNHSIRGAEAERDMRFVERLASSLHLSFEGGLVDVPQLVSEKGLSLQETAREARYRFFKDLSVNLRVDKVALGHNRDDQVETVLMRFLRGSGARGIKGMKPVRGMYIRPLIDIYRREIETYASEKGVEYVVDSSNLEDHYMRNKIRIELIPFLKEKYNPNIKEDVLRFSKSIEMDDEFIEVMAEDCFKKFTESTCPALHIADNLITLELKDILSIHKALKVRIIGKIWAMLTGHKKGLYSCHIENIISILESGNSCASIDLPSGIMFFREYDRVSFKKGAFRSTPSFRYEITIPGLTILPEPGITLKSEIIDAFDHKGIDITNNKDMAFFDYDRLELPLFVRGFEPGDCFRPFGMNGRKKVKDLFIDMKVSRYERRMVPILLSGDEIIWVVGVRRSAEFRIEETTGRVIKIEVEKE